MVEQLAEEQDMNINMVLRLIFQQGLDKIMEERMTMCNYSQM